MALFRHRAPRVIRKGVGKDAVEERKVRRIGRETVEVRRVREVPREKPSETPPGPQPQRQRDTTRQRDTRRQEQRRRRSRRAERPPEEAPASPETERKQMLVRVLPHQTQVVILEGPVLVEHYVAGSDRTSLVGNVYLGKVRNVLPGMEAAFIDFGAAKNGVVYAGDLKSTGAANAGVRIEEVLKPGDDVVVQVVKDAMGAKGARLTAQVSLPGRYLVLVPDSDVQGISRRLPDEVRAQLREILREVRPKGYGVIVRTAAIGASREEIQADIQRLLERWEEIQKAQTEQGDVPRILYEEPDLLIRVIREHFTPDFRRLLIDDRDSHENVVTYLSETAPDLLGKVSLYEDELPLFERFHVEDQLRKALDRKVWLPSGGHLIIDQTEALTVIDVNTGKFVGSSNLEETVLQNNLEAAAEIARQLRLRDIGGIIVIDFIDMEILKNREAVLKKLRESLARDKTRTQVFEVSNLGLVEMTRKNVSAGLLETFSEVCPTCNGRGVILHEDVATHGVVAEQAPQS
jgi:ribonuclease E